MDEAELVMVEYATVGMWVGVTVLGFLYALAQKRAIRHLDIPPLNKTRMQWSANFALLIYLMALLTIGATLWFDVQPTPEYLGRALAGRFGWIVVCAGALVFLNLLANSSRQQESEWSRKQRRRELKDWFGGQP